MKHFVHLCVTVLVFTSLMTARGAMVITTSQGEEFDLPVLYDTNDVIQGLIPAVLEGDLGWHPVNTDPADQLPAFTDGQGMRPTGLTGLLADFPPAGNPAKRILYSLTAPVDVSEIRVFSGNNGRDGRVFHTYTVRFSSDAGQTFTPPIYVQSHLSGTLNNAGHNQWYAALTQLTDDTTALAANVNRVQFEFYGVDNTLGEMRDPFNGLNPFTGADDGFTDPITSPLILEIDLLGQFSLPSLSANSAQGSMILSWVTGLTNAFALQSSTTLQPNSWSTLDPQPQIQADGTRYSATLPTAASPRFYRLIQL